MVEKLLAFHEQIMASICPTKFTKFEKTRAKGKNFVSLGNLKVGFHFRNKKSITYFVTLSLFLFDSGV